MLDVKEIESLRHTEYSSDPTVMELLDTIETLYKENAKLKEDLKLETEMPKVPEDSYYGGCCDGCADGFDYPEDGC